MKKLRKTKINFFKSMSQYGQRESYRRHFWAGFTNSGKNKRWHRCVKRSIKHFEKIALNNIIHDNQQPSPIWEGSETIRKEYIQVNGSTVHYL
jgi:hypothetical protein